MNNQNSKKKVEILQFFIYYFHFFNLKHNVKNVNLENTSLIRDSENNSCSIFLKLFNIFLKFTQNINFILLQNLQN